MTTALHCGDKVLDLSSPQIMGILNITPDSFSDGGLFISASESSASINIDKAMDHAMAMVNAGARIIDVGGESTRPGAKSVSAEEESHRVIPFVKALKSSLPDCLISVDTSKPEIMKQATDSGAHIINDVNALRAAGAIEAVAESNVAVCLMHMQGEPRTMQKNPHYDDVVDDVMKFLLRRIEACISAGIDRNRIVIDPGFGFGKSLQHNLQLFKNLSRFKELGVALLVGVSRKSMIGTILDNEVSERLSGSIALAALATWLGTDILRVHDVSETADAVRVVNAVVSV